MEKNNKKFSNSVFAQNNNIRVNKYYSKNYVQKWKYIAVQSCFVERSEKYTGACALTNRN